MKTLSKRQKYAQMIKAYTSGDNTLALSLARELKFDNTIDASRMKDVEHVILRLAQYP